MWSLCGYLNKIFTFANDMPYDSACGYVGVQPLCAWRSELGRLHSIGLGNLYFQVGSQGSCRIPSFPLGNTTSDFSGTIFPTGKLVNYTSFRAQWNTAFLSLGHNIRQLLHDLLPQRRDSEILSRLRRHTVYPIPRTKTNKYRSFIYYSLAKCE